jgi:hypothetical protein
MAAKKSDKYPYKWPDGTWHSVKWEDTKRGQAESRPIDPPTGSYDPNLDVQGRAEGRAYENTLDDTGTNLRRAGEDLAVQTERYGIDKGRVGEDYDTSKAAIERSTGRSLTDLIQARTRGTEDYGTSLSNLQRQYTRLGNQQGEVSRKMGAEATGGVYAQAARKRAENQALDKAPIDLAYNRFIQDSQTSEGRLGEDKQTSLADLLRGRDRSVADLDWQQGANTLGYSRTTSDINTAATRAGDEHSAFQQDIATAKQLQYGGPGVTVPADHTVQAPAPTQPSSPTSSPAPTSITAAPGAPGVKKTTRKQGRNRVVTYSNSVGGP